MKGKGRQEQPLREENLVKARGERPKIHLVTMDDGNQDPRMRGSKPPASHAVLLEIGHRHIALVGCPCNP